MGTFYLFAHRKVTRLGAIFTGQIGGARQQDSIAVNHGLQRVIDIAHACRQLPHPTTMTLNSRKIHRTLYHIMIGPNSLSCSKPHDVACCLDTEVAFYWVQLLILARIFLTVISPLFDITERMWQSCLLPLTDFPLLKGMLTKALLQKRHMWLSNNAIILA